MSNASNKYLKPLLFLPVLDTSFTMQLVNCVLETKQNIKHWFKLLTFIYWNCFLCDNGFDIVIDILKYFHMNVTPESVLNSLVRPYLWLLHKAMLL